MGNDRNCYAFFSSCSCKPLCVVFQLILVYNWRKGFSFSYFLAKPNRSSRDYALRENHLLHLLGSSRVQKQVEKNGAKRETEQKDNRARVHKTEQVKKQNTRKQSNKKQSKKRNRTLENRTI